MVIGSVAPTKTSRRNVLVRTAASCVLELVTAAHSSLRNGRSWKARPDKKFNLPRYERIERTPIRLQRRNLEVISMSSSFNLSFTVIVSALPVQANLIPIHSIDVPFCAL
eukprot:5323240-Amphidinium_carterae.1